jgi:FMN hydrolase / 5-amino-6-(5-phospho-D-ribitylamino)uracil phosphatase
MSGTKVLLLDVMSTLVHDPIFDAAPAYFGTDARSLLGALSHDAWVAFERGEISEDAYYARCFRDGRAVDGPAFRAAMVAGYRWLPDIVPLLEALQARGVPMHTLSNYPVWYRALDAKLDLARFASWDFVSCETGVRKPDAMAYLGPARALGVAPADCIFVDDRAENVDAAAAVGMCGVRFVDAPQLRASLHELGVLPAPC